MRPLDATNSDPRPSLTLLEQDLASLLAEMLVADIRLERCEREGEATVNHATH
jgi:hypothetical protein